MINLPWCQGVGKRVMIDLPWCQGVGQRVLKPMIGCSISRTVVFLLCMTVRLGAEHALSLAIPPLNIM